MCNISTAVKTVYGVINRGTGLPVVWVTYTVTRKYWLVGFLLMANHVIVLRSSVAIFMPERLCSLGLLTAYCFHSAGKESQESLFKGPFFSFPHDQPFESLFVDSTVHCCNYDLILLLGRCGITFSVASDAVTDNKNFFKKIVCGGSDLCDFYIGLLSLCVRMFCVAVIDMKNSQ